MQINILFLPDVMESVLSVMLAVVVEAPAGKMMGGNGVMNLEELPACNLESHLLISQLNYRSLHYLSVFVYLSVCLSLFVFLSVCFSL